MKGNVNIENRKAYHDYFVEETYECGIELRGNEVKSIKSGMCNLKDAWAYVENGQVYLKGMHITPWETANRFDIDADRDKRLLLHKSEIRKLKTEVEREGKTLVPVKVYVKQGLVKVLLGLCKGKHNYDKRHTIKERDVKREMERYA